MCKWRKDHHLWHLIGYSQRMRIWDFVEEFLPNQGKLCESESSMNLARYRLAMVPVQYGYRGTNNGAGRIPHSLNPVWRSVCSRVYVCRYPLWSTCSDQSAVHVYVYWSIDVPVLNPVSLHELGILRRLSTPSFRQTYVYIPVINICFRTVLYSSAGR